MINYTFNHSAHEKLNIEKLAENHGLMVEFGSNEHNTTVISVDKGGIVTAEDSCNTNAVVFVENCTGTKYIVPIKNILNIRVFS